MIEQEGPQAGASSIRPARRLLKCLVRVRARPGEMAGDGGTAGWGLGHTEVSAGTSEAGTMPPCSTQATHRKEKASLLVKVVHLMSLLMPHITVIPARSNIPAAVFL